MLLGLCLLLNLLFGGGGYTSNLSPDQSVKYINESVQVYYTLDTLSGQQAFEAIVRQELPEHSNKLRAASELKDNSFWIMFRLKNMSESQNQYYLNFAFSRTDRVELFQVDTLGQSVKSLSIQGDSFAFHQRPVSYRSFIFPISMEPMEETTFLLNADKRGSIDRFPLRIMSASTFSQVQTRENIIFGLYFGCFLLVSLLSCVVGAIIRRGVFVFYGLYALLIGVYLLSSLGLTFQFITPNLPSFNYYNLVIFGSWAMVFFSFYSIKYFRPFGKIPLLDGAQIVVTFLLIGIVNVPSIWLTFASESVGNLIISNYMIVLMGNYLGVLLIFIFAFIRAFYFFRASGNMGKLFLIGILCSFLGITYSVLVDNGVFSDFLFDDNSNAVLFGFFGEFIFLTIAMSMILYRKVFVISPAQDDLRFKELHHRVKNNLQVISSLMNLQAIHLGNEEVKKIVADGRERIKAISLVHQKLYMQETNINSLDVKEYVETLLHEISQVHEGEPRVKLVADIQQVTLDIESITSIGMIVNELVINSYKYAFDEISDPKIYIGFKQVGIAYQLNIGDNGKGLPADFSLSSAKSFGLKLVQLLMKQLKATLSIENGETGVNYIFEFSKHSH